VLFAKALRTLLACAEPAFGGLKPSRIDYTKELEQCSILLYGVVKVPQQEPFDRQIVPQKTDMHNRYHNLVSLLKQSTQEYYNMRILLGLKVA
jgi:hypothetical protein